MIKYIITIDDKNGYEFESVDWYDKLEEARAKFAEEALEHTYPDSEGRNLRLWILLESTEDDADV